MNFKIYHCFDQRFSATLPCYTSVWQMVCRYATLGRVFISKAIEDFSPPTSSVVCFVNSKKNLMVYLDNFRTLLICLGWKMLKILGLDQLLSSSVGVSLTQHSVAWIPHSTYPHFSVVAPLFFHQWTASLLVKKTPNFLNTSCSFPLYYPRSLSCVPPSWSDWHILFKTNPSAVSAPQNYEVVLK